MLFGLKEDMHMEERERKLNEWRRNMQMVQKCTSGSHVFSRGGRDVERRNNVGK